MAPSEPLGSGQSRICLDFGTAFSKAGAFLGEELSLTEAVQPLALGAACGAEHALLAPSVLFVDQGRIFMGPQGLARAAAAAGENREPILSFKTILAAQDLQQALSLKLRPAIDPTGTLRHRDGLVLYLAHLDQLIRAAIAKDTRLPSHLADAPRRYTSPIWRTREEADRTMGRLFDEAAFVSQRIGDRLADSSGVSIAQAKEALDAAGQIIGIGQLETGVFEAHAAAAAYAAFAPSPQRFSLVVDMGAGTTDIAGFEADESEARSLTEIVGARQCCSLAGDEIDQIIVALLLPKLNLRAQAAQAGAWRSLRLAARGLKSDLFATDRCVFQHHGRKATLKRSEILEAPQFKDFSRALSEVCAASLRAVVARARATGANRTALLLAGGGANLPFLTDIAKIAAARAGASGSVDISRFGEAWPLPPSLAESHAFPQIAIALGGALAQLSDLAKPTPPAGAHASS